MKFSRREKYLLGALAALIVFAPALNLMAGTPQAQIIYGPGNPVTLTGATAAAPGVTAAGGVVVDTVNTLTNGYLLDVRNNGTSKFTVDYTGLATPAIASTSSTVTTGNVFSIADTSASQTTATGLAVTQSGTTANYTGSFSNFTCSSTTGAGKCVSITGVETTAGSAALVTGDSATTSAAGVLGLSAVGVTTGAAMKITSGAEGTMTNAGSVLAVSDGSVNTFRLGVDSHMTFLQSTAPVVTNTGGSVISCTDGAGTAAKCTDNRGVAIATTSASTNPIVITFHTAYAIAPVCIVTPADATTETDFVSATIKPVATASVSALSITPAANWAVTAHKFNYICME